MIIMELRTDLDNPAFDGRKRSGWQSEKQFPKGTRFGLLGNNGGALAVKFLSGGEPADDQKVIVALLANSGPSEAKTVQEVLAALPQSYFPADLLEALFDDGRIQADDVRRAAQLVSEKKAAAISKVAEPPKKQEPPKEEPKASKTADAGKAGAKAGVPA